jgi:hypothetical protein
MDSSKVGDEDSGYQINGRSLSSNRSVKHPLNHIRLESVSCGLEFYLQVSLPCPLTIDTVPSFSCALQQLGQGNYIPWPLHKSDPNTNMQQI